ncbi:serine/arginine repetitive matrix protein 2 [Streptomyces sp. ms191]|uniref:serine/arginine repetitive matrix protein 2 n=1 Tax=Streptomyces sp. ms191 TaxID=1827978 RepID=UPI0011CE9F65|nr:serine/arginine repetitive matrix protein 2 [Streptomyces sp. ms191]TXS20685.1 serine/arginine repetitive matrix protein 2 [Streptomyces sp. ms191]
MSGDGGRARWNDETQSWETVPGGTAAPGGGTGLPGPVAPVPGGGTGLPGGGPLVPPPPGYAPGPPPYDPGPAAPRSRNVLVAGVFVAVLAAGSVGGWLVWGGGDEGRGAQGGAPGATVTATDPASASDAPAEPGSPTDTGPSSGSPSASDAPMDDLPPPGYHAVEDAKGFTIAVPVDWTRTDEGAGGIFYHSPDDASLVQIFLLEGADVAPYTALQQASRDLAGKNPGYREISLGRVSGEAGAPADAAELVYAYDREGGRRQVVDRAFTATDGRQYAILVAGPVADWPQQRETLRIALDFFRPGPPAA